MVLGLCWSGVLWLAITFVQAPGSAWQLLQASYAIAASGKKMPEADVRASFMRRGRQGFGYDPDKHADDPSSSTDGRPVMPHPTAPAFFFGG